MFWREPLRQLIYGLAVVSLIFSRPLFADSTNTTQDRDQSSAEEVHSKATDLGSIPIPALERTEPAEQNGPREWRDFQEGNPSAHLGEGDLNSLDVPELPDPDQLTEEVHQLEDDTEKIYRGPGFKGNDEEFLKAVEQRRIQRLDGATLQKEPTQRSEESFKEGVEENGQTNEKVDRWELKVIKQPNGEKPMLIAKYAPSVDVGRVGRLFAALGMHHPSKLRVIAVGIRHPMNEDAEGKIRPFDENNPKFKTYVDRVLAFTRTNVLIVRFKDGEIESAKLILKPRFFSKRWWKTKYDAAPKPTRKDWKGALFSGGVQAVIAGMTYFSIDIAREPHRPGWVAFKSFAIGAITYTQCVFVGGALHEFYNRMLIKAPNKFLETNKRVMWKLGHIFSVAAIKGGWGIFLNPVGGILQPLSVTFRDCLSSSYYSVIPNTRADYKLSKGTVNLPIIGELDRRFFEREAFVAWPKMFLTILCLSVNNPWFNWAAFATIIPVEFMNQIYYYQKSKPTADPTKRIPELRAKVYPWLWRLFEKAEPKIQKPVTAVQNELAPHMNFVKSKYQEYVKPVVESHVKPQTNRVKQFASNVKQATSNCAKAIRESFVENMAALGKDFNYYR